MALTPIEERALRHFRAYRKADQARDGDAMRRQLKALLGALHEDAPDAGDVVES